jgi:hypothetical protein
LKPRFLQSFTSKVLFLSGGVLVGYFLPSWLTWLGYPALGADRLVVDLVAGVGYYFLCRFIFLAFQRPQARP